MRVALLIAALVAAVAPTAAVAKPKPLKLKVRELGVFPRTSPAFDQRLMLEPVRDRVTVEDDRTGARYSQPLPAGCRATDVRLPEALLSCSTPAGDRRPAVMSLNDGKMTRYLTDRAAIWTAADWVIVQELRTGRRFKRRFVTHGVDPLLAVTSKRIRVSVYAGDGLRAYRVFEIRLPR